jgi:hypothetical protein
MKLLACEPIDALGATRHSIRFSAVLFAFLAGTRALPRRSPLLSLS